MEQGINIGKLFGIQFRLHYGWFIIFGLVSVFLATQVFPDTLDNATNLQLWIMGICTSLLFFASVIVHELAHSLVGKANGMKVKSITLFIFGGAANMSEEAETAGSEFKMALAGPAASLGLSGIFYVLYINLNGQNPELAIMNYWLAQINLILAVFNLIPGFPLDGGRILRAVFWQTTKDLAKSTRISTIAGQIFGYLFILAGVFILIRTQDWLSGIWLGLLGWYLSDTARNSFRQYTLQQILKRVTPVEVVASDIPRAKSTQIFADYLTQTPNGDYILVEDENGLAGIINQHSLKNKDNLKSTLAELYTPINEIPVIPSDTNALDIARRMNEDKIEIVRLASEDTRVSFITLDSLIAYMNKASEKGFTDA
ncbi:peptidase M50 [Dehalococcoides mccartyi]|jgi:Zn-dependent protease|uniref:Zinc metalloprotease n=1 Tax=Dehalococcoides mccartyi TaxID=61435 RepID=A0A2J1DZR8_9CHLR|nr:site-2 protease family protein [Dehalococcoides mccartyi]AQX74532.1 peptidase M50 [Dehalococcoides mccartyi]AQY73110.1 peptidase M50 [Dehalococcoides mccartyi]OBW63318.1 MAG: peptidase M50 [Dehalococcoides mccartyi]PKH47593.1 peptidase M50 [Dehalococcoides mccartyi]